MDDEDFKLCLNDFLKKISPYLHSTNYEFTDSCLESIIKFLNRSEIPKNELTQNILQTEIFRFIPDQNNKIDFNPQNRDR